jgi:hypothetical protein
VQTDNKKIGLKNESGGVYLARLSAAALFIAAGSAFIPAALFMDLMYSYLYIGFMIAAAVTVFGIVLCSKLVGAFRPIVPICVIAVASVFFSFSTPAAGAVIPIFLCLAALAAYLIRENFLLLALISGIVGAAASVLLTQDVFCAVLSLMFIPVALALHFLFKKGKQRVSSVCTLSFVLGAPIVALFLVFLFINEKAISVNIVKSFFDTLREGLIKGLSEALVEASKQAGAASEIISIADATANMTAIVNTAFNLLPALFIITLFVVTFLIHSLYISMIEPTVKDKKEVMNAITFKMSLASAIFFLISLLASLILQKDQPQISVAAQNIYTILYPGLTMITFAFLGSHKKGEAASCLPTLLYMMLFALLIFFTDIALLVASIAGSIIIILSEISKNKKNNSQNDNFN